MIVATPTSSFYSVPRCPTRPQAAEHCRLNPALNLTASVLPSITQEDRRVCECFNLCNELVSYADAWNWQKSIVRQKKESIKRNEDCPDTLIVLQHQPVYTMGAASSLEFLNFDIKDAPFEVYRTERGGEVTYHGPGQLVIYPIINLRNHKMDLHWYLRALEEVIMRALSSTFSIKASRVEGLTGVWVGNLKLAAIGIKVSQWIAYHGLALNVTTDLSPFDRIIPCGIRNRKVGSIKGLLGVQPSSGCDNANKSQNDDIRLMELTYHSLIKEFSEIFQLKILPKNCVDFGVLQEDFTKLVSTNYDLISNI